MTLRFFSDQCVPAEITDTLRRHEHQSQLMARLLPFPDAHPEQEFYHGKLFLAEVHRVRIRQ